ncbi:hypothetical protein [Tenacibaculum maritimum]|uniref:hypothetical protein n=1 Tax=Tenacibaculum maritimum TaxID=107401 RepID=UPI00041C66D9|nr:hypothetical protein [Tenacibaculum maritimum]MCD9562516.1 hypothetical protein [Tenacibaculum maritimum]MCD9564895.1 hypothetical protein [Tenacibaculum maritimum]MCD9577674.1 hypothetical protein [Tenacibaculum maritimum]MCD9581184.1 hypothetical protein [Tenacibaculum maritimum]MCD9583696.1 hypothetical protein [Tenacibaculum maritimum]
MNDFIDETYKRVEKIIYYKHLNIRSFEENIKVSNNSVGTAIRRKSSFKSNVLNKILNRFPDINPTWLLTGKGSMLLGAGKIYDLIEEGALDYKNPIFERHIKESMLNLFSQDKEIQEALSTYLKGAVEKLNEEEL